MKPKWKNIMSIQSYPYISPTVYQLQGYKEAEKECTPRTGCRVIRGTDNRQPI